MDNRPIGVFDSGVGGLTVVKEIREVLSKESIVYIGDTARVPYGTRSKETIAKFSREIVNRLLQENVKALVVACNTISSTCLPEIYSLTNMPIIDVIVPTVKYAVSKTKSKVIGVIGTSATIKSGSYEKQVNAMDPKIKVVSAATPIFVPIIEEGLFNHRVVDLMLNEYLSPFKNTAIDTLILGCTHYPLIKSKIEKFLGKKVQVIDSGRPTAMVLKELLVGQRMLAEKASPTQIYFTSDSPEKSVKIAREFLGDNLILQKISL